MKTDILIIGSGISGLALAIKLATVREDLSITLVSKRSFSDSNTNLAQGGIAAVMDHSADSIEKHIQDTLIAGDGLCDEVVVRDVVSQGAERIQELINWGWPADRAKQGTLDLALEGGHTAPRVVHSKDVTGQSMVQTLLNKCKSFPNIEMLEHVFTVDLVQTDKTCYGALLYDIHTEEYFSILSQRTILATGGSGQVYHLTTNPEMATGDGVAMASRAGAHISHMEFVQFHPTALYLPHQKGHAFLISEALRGHGATLKHENGHEFMPSYDNRGSLAPRDIVARAISKEMMEHHLDHVYLDGTYMEEEEFKNRFPNIYRKCTDNGINPAKDMIPVAPAAHYMCGGIVTDKSAQSSIINLYAVGECAYTGLHGANRLASNSLLEGLAYAHNCFENLKDIPSGGAELCPKPKSVSFKVNTLPFHPKAIREEMQQTMSSVAGVVRSEMDIRMANLTLTGLELDLMNCTPTREQILEYYQLRNSIMVSELILGHSMSRKENYGGFYKIENVAKK